MGAVSAFIVGNFLYQPIVPIVSCISSQDLKEENIVTLQTNIRNDEEKQ